MIQTTYSKARANFAGLCDEVTQNHEVVVINRRNGGSVAMIATDELESLLASAHLLRSPANAERLHAALGRALGDEGEAVTLAELRQDLGFGG